ncbi:MAG: MarR family transcriptional regulator, transcriptional regulator for hemolysin [Pseudonocardiales bacterium]|jgi:MarR family transcriptional regulator for hemolysin|nr:MarR family transcriptional regulator [Frankiales bacterium]MDQ1737674.1 MarR family transcriptional regulator, transcriptional regulator for hemolysin [Pseudonocardiales bacterium]
MPRPTRPPVGLHLAQVAKIVSRTFDDALAEAGGSLPVWLILITLKSRQLANQRQLAAAVGIQGATLTHHLNAMEATGVLTRRRDPDNRRVHLVELTPAGDALFMRLRQTAVTFDEQLRAGMSEREVTQLHRMLGKLHDNVTAT